MIRIFLTSFIVGVAITVSTTSTAEKKKLPETVGTYFSISGDSVQNFEVTFSHPNPPDQSTAKGAFDAWVAINDGRKEFENERRRMLYAWTDLCTKHLEKSERLLLHADCQADLKAERERVLGYRKKTPSYFNTPIKVKESKNLEDGSVQFIAEGKEVGSEKEYVTLHRITCKKCDDGKWRVNTVETGDYANDEKTEMDWTRSLGNLEFFYTYHGTASARKDIPAAKQGTAEESVSSLFNHLCLSHRWLDSVYNETLMKSYVKALESLCTKEWQNSLKEAAGYGQEIKLPEPRSIESTREDDGQTIIRLKPQQEWNGPLDIHLKKEGESWQVLSAWTVRLPKSEGGKESRKKLKDIYAVQWR